MRLSESEYKYLAEVIKNKIFKPTLEFKTSIFICGADKNDINKARFKISELLQNHWWYKSWVNLVYPEDIFEELLYSSDSKDLLSLEGLLGKSVDIILMIPESPGSFAELGAFANDKLLREKMICILDEKYKKSKSFINQGPIKLVKKTNKNNVLFLDFLNLENEIQKIFIAINKARKYSKKEKEINLLQADNFLLPVLFLLEPIDKPSLVKIIDYAMDDTENSFQVTTAAITLLNKKNLIEYTSIGYKLTKLGKEEFFKYKKRYSRFKTKDETELIDNIRLELLNLKFRKKRIKVG